MTTPTPIAGEFYISGCFIFRLLTGGIPYRYECIRDWDGRWMSYPCGDLGAWPPTAAEKWDRISEDDPLHERCLVEAAKRALIDA